MLVGRQKGGTQEVDISCYPRHVFFGAKLLEVFITFGCFLSPFLQMPASARVLLVGLALGSILILLNRKHRLPVVSWFLKEFGRKE